MKNILCLVALCGAVLSRSAVPIDLSVAGDPTGSSTSDTGEWIAGGAALLLLGELAIELSHGDDRFAGPVMSCPAVTPEVPGDAALGLLVLGYGATASRRRRRQA